jgi:hypothetical protein
MDASPSSRIDAWVCLRSMAFVLDVCNVSRRGGDLIEPLVFAAVVQANQAPLRADSELDRAYAASGALLPDELRRPISIHAIAQSIQLPFETVRRRVRRRVRQQLWVLTPAGAYAPAAAIAADAHAAVQAARLVRLELFHDQLAAAGFLAPGEVAPARIPPALTRPANRILSRYMLRACQRMIGLTGGVMEGFVLLGLACANAEDPAEEPAQRRPLEARPCSGVDLARRLQLPRETARRHLQALRRAGFARGGGRRWLAAVPIGQEPRVAALAAENEADLHYLFARLRELPRSGEA